MTQSEFVGVDGCPCGWFSVGFSSSGDYELQAFFLFEDLLAYYKAAKLILVDIPIGLPDGRGERRCDPQARTKIGSIHRSVFRAPTRAAVLYLANNPSDKQGAKQVEIKTTGKFNPRAPKSLPSQTLAIMPKIGEVDDLLPRKLTPHIREIHPEICFWALNGKSHIVLDKHTNEGMEKRVEILCKDGVEPRARRILDEGWSKYQTHCVGKDDILDALVAAVTAYRGWPDNLQTLPEPPQKHEEDLPIKDDKKCLAMEMVFWQP
jgi:predicted RNase H-like nuclease